MHLSSHTLDPQSSALSKSTLVERKPCSSTGRVESQYKAPFSLKRDSEIMHFKSEGTHTDAAGNNLAIFLLLFTITVQTSQAKAVHRGKYRYTYIFTI